MADLRLRLAVSSSSEMTPEGFLSALNSESRFPPVFPSGPRSLALLRGYVDQWLASGHIKSGADDFSEDFEQRGFTQGPESLSRLGEILGRVQTLLRRTQIVQFDSAGLEIVLSSFRGGQTEMNSLSWAQTEAEQAFVWLLVSDLRNKIAKCHRCGVYLTKKRRFYNEILCRKCSSARSAERITADRRKQLTDKRKNVTASMLRTWHGKFNPDSLDMRKRLANEANQHLGPKEQITSKWVRINYSSLRRVLWRNVRHRQ